MPGTVTLNRTSLYEEHVRAGGKIVPFAGYEMPVQYGSVIQEARAVRERAGMFDVGHMARLWFRGAKALEYLEWITSNDVSKLRDRTGQYSLLPNERGGCVDDIIVYRIEDDLFRMVVNASNHEKDVAWMRAQNSFGVQIQDDTEETGMIAVQGPQAVDILSELSNAEDRLSKPGPFGVVNIEIGGADCFAARSGYTGEDGYELICSAENAPRVWTALLESGVEPCGLASRDALRVEAGLPLYGHELGDDINPISVGLGWVIGKTKAFIGSEPINQARLDGTPTKLQGIKLESKRLLSPGMKVFVNGTEAGEITSGVYSVVLECGIGFAFVDSHFSIGTPCEIDIRGRLEPGMVVSKRFLQKN